MARPLAPHSAQLRGQPACGPYPSGHGGTQVLIDLLWTNDSRAGEHGTHEIQLEPYSYRWFRTRGQDRNVPRG